MAAAQANSPILVKSKEILQLNLDLEPYAYASQKEFRTKVDSELIRCNMGANFSRPNGTTVEARCSIIGCDFAIIGVISQSKNKMNKGRLSIDERSVLEHREGCSQPKKKADVRVITRDENIMDNITQTITGSGGVKKRRNACVASIATTSIPGTSLSRNQRQKLVRRAVKKHAGQNVDAGFNTLHSYLKGIQRANPGSEILFNANKETHVFESCALVLAQGIQIMQHSALRHYSLDAGHSCNVRWTGNVFILELLDGNNRIFPVAFGLFASETKVAYIESASSNLHSLCTLNTCCDFPA